MRLHRIVLFTLMLIVAFMAGQQFPRTVAAQERHRWEYKIVSGFHAIDEMNRLGDDSWEAVTLNASNRVLMRRPK
jgi:hypothetical protein